MFSRAARRVFDFALILVIVLIFSTNLLASVNYANFSNNPNSLTFVGDGSYQNGAARLIDGLFGGGRAAMWTNTTQPVRDGFVCMFSFRISDPQVYSELPPEIPRQGGADGFAFVIHTWGTGAIGNGGGQIGYATDLDGDPLGIPYSLAIEFDTYKNDQLNDPDGNHISVHNAGQYYNSADEADGSSLARINSAALGINMKDGAIHNVRIEYAGTNMKVFVDDFTTPKLDFTVNLDNILYSGSEEATVGFTAGAASESEDHEILNWSFVSNNPDVCPIGVTSAICLGPDAPDADTTGPNSVTSIDYHQGGQTGTEYSPNATIDTAVLPDRPTEIWAKYHFPNNLSGGPFPLVVLLHGNHGSCGIGVNPRDDRINSDYTLNGICPGSYVVAPSHRGYDYLASKLTSAGYIVASINANRGITPSNQYPLSTRPDVLTTFPEYETDNSLIWARGRLVLRHLQRLSEWNEGVTQFIDKTTLGTEKNDFTGWRGMKITIGSTPVRIKSLGRMYKRGNSQTHSVRIVKESDKSIISTVSIPMTNWNHEQFKYVNLTTSVTLAANTSYYIVSQETSGGDKWSDSNTTLVPTGVAVINGRVSSTDGTTYDITGGAVNQAYGPVDFIYEPLDSAYVKTTTLGTVRNNLTGWVGMKITTGDTTVNIRSLGRIFRTGNAQTHTVKIVKASDKSTVGSVSIPMTGGTNGQFKYVNLAAPVTLAPSTSYYVVSQETNAGDQWYDSNTSVTTNGVAVLNGSVSNNGTTTWTEGTTANRTFGPVDFTYEVGSTPAALKVNLKGKIDLSNVGLMGHSRGGEGMRAAYELYNRTNSVWKNTSSRIRSAVNVKGIFEFAPTDGNVTPSLVALNTAWNVLLPACDGDVFYLPGVRPFDRMLHPSIGPTPTPTPETTPKPKSTYYVYGANHNFYNSEWQTSEYRASCQGTNNNPLFSSPEAAGGGWGSVSQQKTGLSSFLAFMKANVGNSVNPTFNQNFDPLYDVPYAVSSITTVERGYTPSPSAAKTIPVNDLLFNAAPLDSNACSITNIVCSGTTGSPLIALVKQIQAGQYAGLSQPVIEHAPTLLTASVTWNAPAPNMYIQANSATGINATTYQTLDFRTSRRRHDNLASKTDPNSLNPAAADTNYSIQLVMNDGSVSSPVQLKDYAKLNGPVGTYNVTGHEPWGALHPILRTVRIPLTKFAGADLAQVKGVRFVFNDTRQGAIFLSAVRLSK